MFGASFASPCVIFSGFGCWALGTSICAAVLSTRYLVPGTRHDGYNIIFARAFFAVLPYVRVLLFSCVFLPASLGETSAGRQ